MDGDQKLVTEALSRMGLAADEITLTRLSGGVSCDVWLVEGPGRAAMVVKRALAKLRVKDDWRAPPERARAEIDWFKLAGKIQPGAAPKIMGEDAAHYMFAMEYLPPENHKLWKAELLVGHADTTFAAQVGAGLAEVHAATAGKANLAAGFAHQVQFFALRISPYLLTAAVRNPDVAPIIQEMADDLGAARIALMHGDVSPKNILIGPDGPVFLDAETACYGDPAFDLAFCLNHLLLKYVRTPDAAYLESFHALKDAYLAGVVWEAPSALETRTAHLLAALLLARMDGKSPVEYITDPAQKGLVREATKRFLKSGESSLAKMVDTWDGAISALQ